MLIVRPGRCRSACQKISDCSAVLALNPHEVKIIPGKGNIPKADQIKLSVKGDIAENTYNIDPSLKYTIVGKGGNHSDAKMNSVILYVYVEPNEKDDTYIAISKEIKSNYGEIIIITDFSPVMINPDKNDARVVFARNKALKFSHVLFCDDLTNTNYVETERKKVDI